MPLQDTPTPSAARSPRWGSFRRGMGWAQRAAERLKLKSTQSRVLAMIASYVDPRDWSGFRICIETLAELLCLSRSPVEKALRRLREAGLLIRIGQIPVKKGRPVVVYALGSPPEAPLPEDVMRARDPYWAEWPPVDESTLGCENAIGTYTRKPTATYNARGAQTAAPTGVEPKATTEPTAARWGSTAIPAAAGSNSSNFPSQALSIYRSAPLSRTGPPSAPQVEGGFRLVREPRQADQIDAKRSGAHGNVTMRSLLNWWRSTDGPRVEREALLGTDPEPPVISVVDRPRRFRGRRGNGPGPVLTTPPETPGTPPRPAPAPVAERPQEAALFPVSASAFPGRIERTCLRCGIDAEPGTASHDWRARDRSVEAHEPLWSEI